MNAAQVTVYRYWKARHPDLMRTAVARAGATGMTGFGQTDTFSSVMGNLTNLLTSYGQYKIASDVAASTTAANRNVLSLPGSGTTGSSMNWIMIGGVALIAIVGIAIFAKRRKS